MTQFFIVPSNSRCNPMESNLQNRCRSSSRGWIRQPARYICITESSNIATPLRFRGRKVEQRKGSRFSLTQCQRLNGSIHHEVSMYWVSCTFLSPTSQVSLPL